MPLIGLHVIDTAETRMRKPTIKMSYSIFNPHKGAEGKSTGGAPETMESKTETAFLRGSGQVLQRGDDS